MPNRPAGQPIVRGRAAAGLRCRAGDWSNLPVFCDADYDTIRLLAFAFLSFPDSDILLSLEVETGSHTRTLTHALQVTSLTHGLINIRNYFHLPLESYSNNNNKLPISIP